MPTGTLKELTHVLYVKELELHVWTHDNDTNTETCSHTKWHSESGKRGSVDWYKINELYGDAEIIQVSTSKKDCISVIAFQYKQIVID